MKIIKLHIKNLNSLKGEHIINFDQSPLGDTGLFAITGPTGAGKSTLLDAISLALYNQIPRSGKISKNSIQSFGTLITKGTNDCFAELTYSVNNKHYRSKWEISRARTGNLRDYHMDLSEELEDGSFISCGLKKGDIPSKNTEITGLNYEQFVKSIMLSQGEFARFLKANATERSELLEKITGTEIYRQIGKAAYEKLKEQETIAHEIELKMHGISLLTEEQLNEINEKQLAFKQEIQTTQQLLEKIQKQIQETQLFLKTEEEQKTTMQRHVLLQKEQETFAPELLKLNKHNQLVSIKGELIQLTELKKQVASLQQKIAQQKQQLEQLEKEKQTLSVQFDKRQKEFENAEKEQTQLTPIIKKASILDEKIKLKTEELSRQEKELNNFRKELKEQATFLDQQQKLNSEKKGSFQKQEEELKLQSSLSEVPATISLLDQLMGEMASIHQQLKHELLQLENQEISSTILGNINWKQNHIYISNQIVSISKQQKELDKELNNFAFNDQASLNQQLQNANLEINKLNELLKLQQQFVSESKELQLAQKQWKELETELNKHQESLKQLAPQIQIFELKEKEQTARLDRLRIEQSLEKHRQELKPEQPCPLCGSTTHPYVQNYSHDLPNLASELQTTQTELEKRKQQQQSIQKRQAAVQANVKTTDEKIEQLKSKTELIQKQFAALNANLKIEDKSAIEKQLDKHQKTINQLTKAIKAAVLRDKLQANLLLLKPIQEKIEKIANHQQKSSEIIEPFAQWLTNEKSLKSKRDRLNLLFTSNKDKQDKQNTLEKEINQLTERISALTEQQKVNRKKEQELGYQFNAAQQLLNGQKKERFDLFQNKSTTQEQERIDNSVKEKRQTRDLLKERATKNSEHLKHTEKQIKEDNTQLQSTNKQQQDFEQALATPLQELSFANIEEALAAFLSKEEEQSIKAKEEQLKKEETTILQKLKELEKFINENKEKLPSVSLEELKQNQQTTQKQYQLLNKESGALEQQLKQNEANKQQAGDLVKELEVQRKELKRWQNLNELIGDATGNKYSKFAQELTLQQMLSLANRHLMKLNPRYLLKYNTQQNEDLFVVDTLQGNEERSVRTLSGGESFLISLALALGLSDLAGKNTQLESLFIDEGFGSLDQVTLEMALNTLERLQSENNRTIGIISHVEALKERITTQIELVKDSSGNSQIVIHQ